MDWLPTCKPWLGCSIVTRFGDFPPKKYFRMVETPSDPTHPTMALDPIILPLDENPMATYAFWLGADSKKFHTERERESYPENEVLRRPYRDTLERSGIKGNIRALEVDGRIT
ncbi:2-C-methyl-D-erythritol 4-phosphatecytidylyltransferase [Striga asiatica]|uniref:2-C-methyl-D-erythritol 4-phosphatecytidylyltransferase n=1 Tax=Striga asiatica TaxID=4170 RepID=A0A5A7RDW0_STRAF|nr:2-C-methyl-D-erythritol 4-phosphatecytidylyltransferase [Striga asiatica]